jgi:DNA-binding NarL/FixJ family response regulator
VTLNLLLVEDEPLTRTAVKSSLEAAGYQVIGSFSDVASAVQELRKSQVDVVVLDIDLGTGPTGLDLAALIDRTGKPIGIVIMTSSIDPRLVRKSLPEVPSQAVYLIKEQVVSIEMITQAINQAYQNVISGEEVKSRIKDLPLNDVQIETLRLVAQGLTNQQIAKERFVTEKAVEYTISKIAEILDIQPNSTANQRVNIARTYFQLRGIRL